MKQLVNAVQVHRLRITLSPLLHSLLNACSQVCKASRVIRTVNNDVIIIVVNMELPCCSAARIHHWEVSRAVSCCVPNNECDSSLLGIGYPASTFHGADEFIIAIAREDDLIHHTHACIPCIASFHLRKVQTITTESNEMDFIYPNQQRTPQGISKVYHQTRGHKHTITLTSFRSSSHSRSQRP